MALTGESLGGGKRLLGDSEPQPKQMLTSSKDNSGGKDGASRAGSTGSSTVPRVEANFPLVVDPSHIEAAQAFSILRSRLLSLHKKAGIRTVIITSSDVGDGKTMVATNLALSLGELGSKRILLVDGDLRAASATKILKMNHLPGMGDFLQGKRQFDAVIHPTQFQNLSVAPTGLVPKNTLPAILEGPHWPEFIEQAKAKFDLIIIDTVPVSAPVADLELLMAPCDGYLLVVHMRQTRRPGLKRVNVRLDAKKCLGAILNNDNELYDYAHEYYYVRPKNPK
jgi:capsular exopolysaccharide synthesis family protein